MSKYDKLWKYIQESSKSTVVLTFDDITKIIEIPLDHSFLQHKKEALAYGYCVKKISIKTRNVIFEKC